MSILRNCGVQSQMKKLSAQAATEHYVHCLHDVILVHLFQFYTLNTRMYELFSLLLLHIIHCEGDYKT